MSARVLVIESALAAGTAVRRALLQSDFDVEWVADAEAARRALTESKFWMAVLEQGADWSGLPDELQFRASTAGSMLAVGRWTLVSATLGVSSSSLNDAESATAAATCGLTIRVRTLLEDLDRYETDWVSVCRPSIEWLGGRVVLLDGVNKVRLTPMEHALLAALMARPGAIVSHESLMSTLRRWEEGARTRTVEAHVSGLRRKVGFGLVENVRGVGYRVGSRSSDARLDGKGELAVALRVSRQGKADRGHAPSLLWTYFDLAKQRSIPDETAPEANAGE